MVLVQQGYHLARFAGALKDMLRAYLRYCGANEIVIEQLIEDYRAKETPHELFAGRSPRYVMQTLGTEWGRDLVASDLWVNACLQHCAGFSKSVITDVRFPNEVEAVKQAGGVVVRIVRGITHGDTHPSENFIDTLDVDYEIHNDGTIPDLQGKLLTIVKGQTI